MIVDPDRPGVDDTIFSGFSGPNDHRLQLHRSPASHAGDADARLPHARLRHQLQRVDHRRRRPRAVSPTREPRGGAARPSARRIQSMTLARHARSPPSSPARSPGPPSPPATRDDQHAAAQLRSPRRTWRSPACSTSRTTITARHAARHLRRAAARDCEPVRASQLAHRRAATRCRSASCRRSVRATSPRSWWRWCRSRRAASSRSSTPRSRELIDLDPYAPGLRLSPRRASCPSTCARRTDGCWARHRQHRLVRPVARRRLDGAARVAALAVSAAAVGRRQRDRRLRRARPMPLTRAVGHRGRHAEGAARASGVDRDGAARTTRAAGRRPTATRTAARPASAPAARIARGWRCPAASSWSRSSSRTTRRRRNRDGRVRSQRDHRSGAARRRQGRHRDHRSVDDRMPRRVRGRRRATSRSNDAGAPPPSDMGASNLPSTQAWPATLAVDTELDALRRRAGGPPRHRRRLRRAHRHRPVRHRLHHDRRAAVRDAGGAGQQSDTAGRTRRARRSALARRQVPLRRGARRHGARHRSRSQRRVRDQSRSALEDADDQPASRRRRARRSRRRRPSRCRRRARSAASRSAIRRRRGARLRDLTRHRAAAGAGPRRRGLRARRCAAGRHQQHAWPPVPASPGVLVGDFAWIITSDGEGTVVNIYDACPQPNQQDPNAQAPNFTPVCDPGNVQQSLSTTVAQFGHPQPSCSTSCRIRFATDIRASSCRRRRATPRAAARARSDQPVRRSPSRRRRREFPTAACPTRAAAASTTGNLPSLYVEPVPATLRAGAVGDARRLLRRSRSTCATRPGCCRGKACSPAAIARRGAPFVVRAIRRRRRTAPT